VIALVFFQTSNQASQLPAIELYGYGVWVLLQNS